MTFHHAYCFTKLNAFFLGPVMLILDANSIVLAAEDDLQHERLVYNFVSCLPHEPIAMSRLRHEPIATMMDLFGLRALPSIDWRHTSNP